MEVIGTGLLFFKSARDSNIYEMSLFGEDETWKVLALL